MKIFDKLFLWRSVVLKKNTLLDLFKPFVGHWMSHSWASTVSPSQYFPCGVQLLLLFVNPLPQNELDLQSDQLDQLPHSPSVSSSLIVLSNSSFCNCNCLFCFFNFFTFLQQRLVAMVRLADITNIERFNSVIIFSFKWKLNILLSLCYPANVEQCTIIHNDSVGTQ